MQRRIRRSRSAAAIPASLSGDVTFSGEEFVLPDTVVQALS